MAWFTWYLFVSLVSVAVARFRRGPLLPTWRFGYEVLTQAQKRFHERVARLAPLAERRAWASLKGSNPSRNRVIRSRSSLAGCEVVQIVPRDRPSPARVILYLHGGSFMYGSEQSHGELCSRIAVAAEARLVFLVYRLAPEHPFPAALDDARSAFCALLDAGVAPADLVVAGDSAGGNLALSLLLTLRSATLPFPAAAILISPWVDLTDRSGSMTANESYDWASPWMFDRWQREYLAGKNAEAPLASPALADLHGLPPLLIQVGTAELLHDQVTAVAKRAREANVEVTLAEFEHRAHLWHALTPVFPEFQASIDQIGSYVLRHTASLTPKHHPRLK